MPTTLPSFPQPLPELFREEYLCDVEYCDFVVCTFPDKKVPVIRVFDDQDFWLLCVGKSTEFFKVCILLEILGRWYTRSKPVTQLESAASDLRDKSTNSAKSKKYCYCQQPEHEGEEMIGCNHKNCKIEWFHTKCLKIRNIPNKSYSACVLCIGLQV